MVERVPEVAVGAIQIQSGHLGYLEIGFEVSLLIRPLEIFGLIFHTLAKLCDNKYCGLQVNLVWFPIKKSLLILSNKWL